jgi:hypothetical protein
MFRGRFHDWDDVMPLLAMKGRRRRFKVSTWYSRREHGRVVQVFINPRLEKRAR